MQRKDRAPEDRFIFKERKKFFVFPFTDTAILFVSSTILQVACIFFNIGLHASNVFSLVNNLFLISFRIHSNIYVSIQLVWEILNYSLVLSFSLIDHSIHLMSHLNYAHIFLRNSGIFEVVMFISYYLLSVMCLIFLTNFMKRFFLQVLCYYLGKVVEYS